MAPASWILHVCTLNVAQWIFDIWEIQNQWNYEKYRAQIYFAIKNVITFDVSNGADVRFVHRVFWVLRTFHIVLFFPDPQFDHQVLLNLCGECICHPYNSGQTILLNDRSDRSKPLRSIIDRKVNLRSIIYRFFLIVKWIGLLLWKQYIIITVRLRIWDNSHLL